jgi:hypothetical protein
MRWLFILSLSVRLFGTPFEEITPSTAEEIFSLTSNLLVDGFVSVSSGQIVLSETDLCVRGAVPDQSGPSHIYSPNNVWWG